MRSGRPRRWLWTGIALGLLNVVVANVHLAGRPIGASTGYPWAAAVLAGLRDSLYFREIDVAGAWELLFLVGGFVGGLLGAFVTRSFRLRTVPALWERTRGPGGGRRLAWAFAGGFVLVLGARLAGGCSSGHVLSGGMQLAASSLLFAVFVLLSFVVTARWFYGGAR
jgi:uncharacterized membrane protein YedE/YeeE